MNHRDWQKARRNLTSQLDAVLRKTQTPETMEQVKKLNEAIATCDEQREKAIANSKRGKEIVMQRRMCLTAIARTGGEKAAREAFLKDRDAKIQANIDARKAAKLLRQVQAADPFVAKVIIFPDTIERDREDDKLQETAEDWADVMKGVTPLAKEDA